MDVWNGKIDQSCIHEMDSSGVDMIGITPNFIVLASFCIRNP